MIDLLDDALREFLIKELPVRDNEIDISFDQPKREWSARLSRPTVNVYLRDIRENTKLRATTPGGSFTRTDTQARFERDAVRIELAYMITAWAKDPLDEHRILSRLLTALFRFRGLPQDVAAEFLPDQPADLPFKVAQPESTISANDIWSVLDNEMRPYVDLIAQLAVFPHTEVVYPLVRSIDITLVQRPGGRPGAAPGVGESQGQSPLAPVGSDGATAPNGRRLPIRVQQVPNGKTPEARRTSPPWPPGSADDASKPPPAASPKALPGSPPDAPPGKGRGGKGSR